MASTPAITAEQQALLDAVRAVLAPLAQLAVARGLPFAALEEVLKREVVRAAAQAHPNVQPHRGVSRIATATGINRREVTRLTQQAGAAAAAPPSLGRSLASELFAHWLSAPAYRDRQGAPRVLPRQGPAPSFESLAQTVTRDVHPRSLLDELLRLKLAHLDEDADTVALVRESFVPSGDRARILGFLADNVGDHLNAAVGNVLGGGKRHFEQAVFADGLSDASLQAVRGLVGAQWKLLVEALVPPLQGLIVADTKTPASAQRRVRIGLFAFDDAPTVAGETQPGAQAAPVPKRRVRATPKKP